MSHSDAQSDYAHAQKSTCDALSDRAYAISEGARGGEIRAFAPG